MDGRISELPEIIIQHILSFLETKEAAQTSILSKTWLRFWSTRSILDFDYQIYVGIQRSLNVEEDDADKFIKFVENTLRGHQQQRIRIQKFMLSIIANGDDKIVSLLPTWLKFSTENNVGEIHLWTNKAPNPPYDYVVLNTIFEAKSLIVLEVCGPKFFVGGTNINCHYLKTLLLDSVYVDERTIQNIVRSCPLIEEFCLEYVNGLEIIRVANLFNLKIFRVITTSNMLKVICIEAPSLKYLALSGVSITDRIFNELLSHSPKLENLILFDCNTLERINISNHSLKEFRLFGAEEKLVELIIDSPNLLFLDIVGHILLKLSFASALGQGKLDICISYISSDYVDFSRFYQLREFLTKFNVSSVSLDIGSRNISFTYDWRAISSLPPQHEVEKLTLSVDSCISPLTYPAFVNGLFWSCHPKTLFLLLFNIDFIEFLCMQLQERSSGNCCNSDPIKCWRHHLQYWNIKIFDDRRNEWKPLHWEGLADASQTLEAGLEIYFTLEWGQLGQQV